MLTEVKLLACESELQLRGRGESKQDQDRTETVKVWGEVSGESVRGKERQSAM